MIESLDSTRALWMSTDNLFVRPRMWDAWEAFAYFARVYRIEDLLADKEGSNSHNRKAFTLLELD